MFQQMIEIDPPEHTAMRALVSRVFTVRRVAEMEDEVRRIVNHYIDTVIESGHADLMTDVAGCFPMDVISAVLGIPEADRETLRDCADRGLTREDGSMEIPQEAYEAIFEVLAYFTEDLDRRRAGRVPRRRAALGPARRGGRRPSADRSGAAGVLPAVRVRRIRDDR